MRNIKTLLLLFSILCFGTEALAYDVYIDSIYYNINIEKKTAEVTYLTTYSGNNERAYKGDVIIPSYITLPDKEGNDNYGGNYTVTSIGYKAFQHCSRLTSVIIPNSVTSIGSYAFSCCYGLTSITIPNSVTWIGEYAFAACYELTSISIPNSVTWIGEYAFLNCSKLTSVSIPNSVTSIGDYAFSGCSGLASITIPNFVTSIGNRAFERCSSLASINIPNSVTSIGDCAFKSCSSLTSITIPNSVTNIGNGAFRDCSSLTSITIPNSMTSIGIGAFSNCSNLKSVEFPSSIKSIGANAFEKCGITSIYLPNCDVNEHIFGSEYDSYKQLENVYCYPNVYGILSDKYPKTLMGGSIFGVRSNKVTQTTVNLQLYEKTASAKAPEGWPTYSIKEKAIEIYLGNKYIVEEDGTAHITGLAPNKAYTVYAKIKYDNGSIYNGYYYNYRTIYTQSMKTDFKDVSCGPTTIIATGKYTLIDAHISETYFEIGKGGYNLKRFDGDNLDINGLDPNSSYYIVYHVKTTEGSDEYVSKTITTPQLELTTLQPKCVSSSCAIVAATTNIGESETNVGFQWKKFDAPASLKPSEGYAAIYGGQLEGYIKNLQATSYYNVRAFYKSTDGQYFYGDWVTFDPSDFSYFEPTVHTYDVTDVTASTAKVKGYVLAGTDNITEQGFEYRPMGSGTNRAQAVRVAAAEEQAGDDVFTVFATGQVMTAELRNLKPETTYVCRAFVKTVNGTTYGEEQTFTTGSDVTGIAGVEADAEAPTVEGYYDMSGRKIDTPKRGVNIIRYTDGTARKVFVK